MLFIVQFILNYPFKSTFFNLLPIQTPQLIDLYGNFLKVMIEKLSNRHTKITHLKT